MAFALTKIQPPRPRSGALLARPSLEHRLGEALLARRLVLVCAAAGFGKTSLLAGQLERLPADCALAWVACDASDSPAQIFECLLAALEPFDPPWRAAPEALMRSAADAATPAQWRAVAAEIINALDACEVAHGVIVLDDLHRIEGDAVHAFLDALLERLTPRWTLVLATRLEPPLAMLPRLRALDEVAEFRPADLRFDRDEALRLAAQLGLAPELGSRLYERTQGWPVGLRLALNAARALPQADTMSAPGGAIDRHAFDYITAEVIDHLSPALRHFLLTTSLLPELTVARAAVLSGDAQAALRLDEIERAGLFATPLASSEPTWRLHDLFRESLEARLRRERPQDLPTLLRSAATTETDPLRRVAWWLQAGDWAEAERDLAAIAEGLVTQGKAPALRELLARFPTPLRDGSPALQLVRAQLGWSRWDWESAIDATERAAVLLAEQDDPVGARAALSYHCVALAGANRDGARDVIDELLAHPRLDGDSLARTLVASSWVELRRGDQRTLAPLWERLLDTLVGIESLPRWYECCPLPPFIGLPGMRAPLQRYVNGALARVPELPTPLRGMCQVLQGWLHLWAGDIDAAEAGAAAAEADSRWLARPVNVDSYARSLRAVLLALRGLPLASAALIDGLIEDVEGSPDPMRTRVYLSFYLFVGLRCAAINDDTPRITALAARLRADDPLGQSWLSSRQMSSAPAHAAAARGDLATAVGVWQELLTDEHHADIYGQVVETRLRLADALLCLSRPPAEAVAVLRPVFAQLAASSEWGAMLMAGPAVLGRLAAHDWQAALDPGDLAWLARSAQRLVVLPPDTGGAAPSPASLLSARERDVLERIAAGDSNKLIARAFELSPHTVKRHVANILDKLGLASRGQAAAWYREKH